MERLGFVKPGRWRWSHQTPTVHAGHYFTITRLLENSAACWTQCDCDRTFTMIADDFIANHATLSALPVPDPPAKAELEIPVGSRWRKFLGYRTGEAVTITDTHPNEVSYRYDGQLPGESSLITLRGFLKRFTRLPDEPAPEEVEWPVIGRWYIDKEHETSGLGAWRVTEIVGNLVTWETARGKVSSMTSLGHLREKKDRFMECHRGLAPDEPTPKKEEPKYPVLDVGPTVTVTFKNRSTGPLPFVQWASDDEKAFAPAPPSPSDPWEEHLRQERDIYARMTTRNDQAWISSWKDDREAERWRRESVFDYGTNGLGSTLCRMTGSSGRRVR